MEGCVAACTFTWSDGHPGVGRTRDELGAPGAPYFVETVLGGRTQVFTARSTIIHRFTPGTHVITVRVIDAAGHVLATTTIVRAVEAALPATDEMAHGKIGRPIAEVVAMLGLLTFGIVLILPRRRRRNR